VQPCRQVSDPRRNQLYAQLRWTTTARRVARAHRAVGRDGALNVLLLSASGMARRRQRTGAGLRWAPGGCAGGPPVQSSHVSESRSVGYRAPAPTIDAGNCAVPSKGVPAAPTCHVLGAQGRWVGDGAFPLVRGGWRGFYLISRWACRYRSVRRHLGRVVQWLVADGCWRQ